MRKKEEPLRNYKTVTQKKREKWFDQRNKISILDSIKDPLTFYNHKMRGINAVPEHY